MSENKTVSHYQGKLYYTVITIISYNDPYRIIVTAENCSSWKSLTDMNLKYIFNNTIMLEFN